MSRTGQDLGAFSLTKAVRSVRKRTLGQHAVTGLTLLALMSIAVACGSGNGSKSTPTQGPSVVLPTATLPALPPGSADQTGLLIYVDPIARQTIALNLSNGDRRVVPGIVPSAGTSMIADCTYDGRLIAYTNSAISQQASTVSFLGEGAPGKSIEVKGAIQGMAWSPAGDRLAITVGGIAVPHLELLDVQSGATTVLPSGKGIPGSARWSPDGQRLAVDVNNNGISDIYVLDVAASSISKISSRPSAEMPDWSPDGRTIVFSAGDERGGLPEIYAVDPDGKNEHKLTASASEKYSPRWSRDGSLIAYAGIVTVPVASSRPARLHNQAIWVARADGTNELPVTDVKLDAAPLAWCLQGPWLQ